MPKPKTDEAPEIFRGAILYREWGYRLTDLEKFIPAIAYFEKALEHAEKEDLRTLLGLCRVQTVYTRYNDAESTSKRCTAIDPNHSHVKDMRVQNLFQIGEFGHSLVYAHQAMRQRRMPFEWAVFQAEETLEDCVGRNTSAIALLLLYPWIEKLRKHREFMMEKLKEEEDELEGVDEDRSKFKVNDPTVQRESCQKKLQRVIAKMYLGYLAHDKDFAERIMQSPELVASPNKESSNRLHGFAVRSYRKSVLRQDIMRTRKPLYVTLFKRREIPVGRRAALKAEERLKRNNIIIEADFLLRKLHDVRMDKDYPTFFRLADRIKDKYDSYSDRIFPSKRKCLNALYRTVGWAYIDARNLTTLLDERQKEVYVKHHLGMHVAKLPRDEDIAWVTSSNKRDRIKVFRKRLAMATEPLEIAWLLHEFCKFHIENRRYDLARFYVRKTRDAAQAARNDQWSLNALHLAIRMEVGQRNRNEAKEVSLQALAEARRMGIDHLVDFYTRAIRVLSDIDVDALYDEDGIKTRQQLILELMPEKMRRDVDFLWRSMEAVPAERRMSVMPGCKPVDRRTKLPCKRRTILPAPPRDTDREAKLALLKLYAPSKEIPGFVDFEALE